MVTDYYSCIIHVCVIFMHFMLCSVCSSQAHFSLVCCCKKKKNGPRCSSGVGNVLAWSAGSALTIWAVLVNQCSTKIISH